ncbi:MAG: hypothetical protein IJ333_00840 [Clostridia bacterium]|nr:hypothetical protein [Clostridia bacterium]
MNRKNWMSALLAVMMVISMMAVIALPAVAADYTALPLASTSVKEDGITEYQINSVEELVAASKNIVNPSADSYECVSYDPGDTIYITADLDISTYQGDFAADYANFTNHASGYTYLRANIDGLGHTISNYTHSKPFIGGTLNATIKNLTFKNAVVTAPAGKGTCLLVRTTEFGMEIDNVHVIDSTVNGVADYASYNSIMVQLSNGGSQAKSVAFRNCSIINCALNCPNTSSQYNGLYIGLFGGRKKSDFIMENCIAVNSTLNQATSAGNTGGILVGYVNQTQADAMNEVVFRNVGVFGCTLQSSNEGTYFSIVSTINNGDGTFIYDSVHAIGNVYSTDATVTTDDVPLTKVLINRGNDFTLQTGTAYTDVNVEYALYEHDDATTSVANTKVDDYTMLDAIRAMNEVAAADTTDTYLSWGYDMAAGLPVIGYGDVKPMSQVQFDMEESMITLYTDTAGKLIVDAGTLATLKGYQWTVEGSETPIAKNYAWEEQIFDTNAYYFYIKEVPQEYLDLPSVMTATEKDTNDDDPASYRLSTLEELVFVSNHIYNYGAEDTIYLVNDLYVTETYEDTASGSSKVFADEFNGFLDVADNLYNGYCYGRFTVNINGLGHTIYNYKDTHAFVASTYNGTMSNLNFENAVVDAQSFINKPDGVTVNNATAIVTRTTETGAAFENVHVRNSKLTALSNSQYVSVFMAISNGAGKNVTFRNCSVMDTDIVVEATKDATGANLSLSDAGFFIGLFGAENLIMENCIAVDSTIKSAAPVNTARGNGFLAGYIHQARVAVVTMDNVAVVGCTFDVANAPKAQFGILAGVCNVKKASNENAINAKAYVADNKMVYTDVGEDGVTPIPAESTIETLYYLNYNGGMNFNSFEVYTDTGVVYGVKHVYDGATDESHLMVPALNIVDELNLNSVIALMNDNEAAEGAVPYKNWAYNSKGVLTATGRSTGLPAAVTFSKQDDTIILDVIAESGKLNADADMITTLQGDEWTLSTAPETVIPYGYAWGDETYSANTLYNAVPHILTYTPNEDGTTHKITCGNAACNREDHKYTNVVCDETTSVRVPEKDIAATHYNHYQEAYLCICGREWLKPIPTENPESPINIAYAKDDYYSVDETAAVKVGLNENSNIAAVAITVNFNAEYFTYVDYTDAAQYLSVVSTDAANGVINLTYVNYNGDYVVDAMNLVTLNFTLANEKITPENTPETVVTATITDVVAKNLAGEADDALEALTPVVTDIANLYYISATFTPGDVDSDGYVDLLDVILLVQKLNATIHESQDFPAFHLMAADVTADGTMDTADVVLLMQFVADMDVELQAAEEVPTWVVITPAPEVPAA